MDYRIRQGSPTDAPSLMHIEHACRVAAGYLPEEMRFARPRLWRPWLQCNPPFNRNPSVRRIYVAFQHTDILGFVAAAHDSLYGGYDSHIHGLYVLPRYRRQRIGFALLHFMAVWLDNEGLSRATVDTFAGDPTRQFFHRRGAFVISTSEGTPDPASIITYGFPDLRQLAVTIS